jgi:hypothetical protein
LVRERKKEGKRRTDEVEMDQGREGGREGEGGRAGGE